MRECCGDGDLRAYVDGELADRAEVAAHLESCAECRARYGEIAARAARVSTLMGMLSEAPRVGQRRRWIAAALALAAALAIGFVVFPKHRDVASAPVAKASAPAVAAPAVATAPRSVVRHAAVRRPAVRESFVRLDDDPLETGVIVRVSAENGDVQADLIVGPDGRAHAIRVVSNQ